VSPPNPSRGPQGATLLAAFGRDKIQPWHLERLAIVYVRQSDPQQVIKHKESAALQYGLKQQAQALGWPEDRILVIDEDQGHTAKTVVGRLGFHLLMAEVGLDHVGIIVGIEMSRLARCNKDWHQLLELCAIFRTLLADPDGLYDPTNYNDRLLLGLKGTMSEAELHILRSRMLNARMNKARRGEVFSHPPMGYVRLPAGGYGLDPDQQVQSVIRLIFDEFDRQGSLHGLLRYLVHHGIRLGIRPHGGPNRGQLEWHRPNRITLQNLLRHPIYAGAYRYGHRSTDARRQVPGRPGTGRTVLPPERCPVLLRDHLPAYITWERFEANQRRLSANRARQDAQGAPREGPSLLAGLVVCGRCGQRMTVSYGGRASRLRYSCGRAATTYAEPQCQSLAGEALDELVAEQVLIALQPAALELSLRVADDLDQERARLEQNWQQRLERCAYEVDRAGRQHNACEPENRLVARELERRWEEALRQQRQLREEYDRFRQSQSSGLMASERASILALAQDIPALWQAATTTAADRQRVARFLLRRVVVTVQGASERVAVSLEWVGGLTSQHELIRPVNCYTQRSDYVRLMTRVGELRGQGLSLKEVAVKLNEEQFQPPKRAAAFTHQMVARLERLQRQGTTAPPGPANDPALQADEWWPQALAARLGMPHETLRKWMQLGWVHCQQRTDARRRWVVWADAEEVTRLLQLRACDHSWANEERRRKLTVPKPRPQN
jgi:DNA invertase Pin-like site-specific DNA recombinase/DNA-binding transcriptional MerR regulator